MLSGNTDAPVYYLQHKHSGNILLLDKEPDKFPADYVQSKIKTTGMNFSVFQYLYEESKEKHYKLILTQSDKDTLINLLKGRDIPEKHSKIKLII